MYAAQQHRRAQRSRLRSLSRREADRKECVRQDRLICPDWPPSILLIRMQPGVVELQYLDENGSKRKPRGASEIQLFIAITDAHDAPVDKARFYRKFSSNPMRVEFDSELDGKVATYYGRWASPTGETGPWSLPVSLRIVSR